MPFSLYAMRGFDCLVSVIAVSLMFCAGAAGKVLGFRTGKTEEHGITMSEELLCICKGSFHGFPAPLVNGLAPRCKAILISALTMISPHMARDINKMIAG